MDNDKIIEATQIGTRLMSPDLSLSFSSNLDVSRGLLLLESNSDS